MESGPKQYPKAFPTSEEYESEGMTLRDYFAAKALESCFLHHKEFGGSTWDEQIKEVALSCYSMADAMLKARQS